MKSRKKYGLIGHPISHSLSPALFRAGFGDLYNYDLIETVDFKEAYSRFMNEYDAVNVTAPFKEKACRKADILSDECKIIGACNVLKKTEDGVLAANTDYLGVMQSLLPYQKEGKFKPITMVVGCGGAGKAAAYAALKLGNIVMIVNRDVEKARNFAEWLWNKTDKKIPVIASPLSYFCRGFKAAGTIIYTLPVAIPQIEELKKRHIQGGIFRKEPKIILEANYNNPTFTPSLQSAMTEVNEQIQFISGHEWLLHQAVSAYEIFTEHTPNIDEMVRLYKK